MKMVKYSTLLKIIENEVRKCKATAQAKKIGSSAKWETLYDKNGKEKGSKVTYSDGTSITYDKNRSVTRITMPNGEKIDYLQNKSYDFFEDFTSFELQQKYGQETYELFKKYCGIYYGYDYRYINSYLRGDIDEDRARYKIGDETFDFIMDNQDMFNIILNDNSISKLPTFITVRETTGLFKNDNPDKKIVKDKGYSSASVGMSTRDLKATFGSPKGYTIITVYEKGNNASTGAFLGHVLKGINGFDFEREFLTAPDNKFSRSIIDMESKIIIQVPYKP